MSPMSDVLAMAMQYHRAGDLQQAERLYRQILQQYPRHAEALHLLGVLAHQAGHVEPAIQCIRQALEISPDFPEAHANLANSLMAVGQFTEAEQHCRRAIQIKPDYVDAYNNLGISLRRQGSAEGCRGDLSPSPEASAAKCVSAEQPGKRSPRTG